MQIPFGHFAGFNKAWSRWLKRITYPNSDISSVKIATRGAITVTTSEKTYLYQVKLSVGEEENLQIPTKNPYITANTTTPPTDLIPSIPNIKILQQPVPITARPGIPIDRANNTGESRPKKLQTFIMTSCSINSLVSTVAVCMVALLNKTQSFC